jgi:ATP-dependent RNA helicase DDX19/DBP5
MNFTKPSRIQAETLPMILGTPPRHLIAQAHNGSGKTTCFVLGMLSRVDPSLHKPQALCICPTRELVVQNMEVLRKMATHTSITCATTASMDDKAPAARSRMPPLTDHVVIATPGRLMNWITHKTLPVKCVSHSVCFRQFCSGARVWRRGRAA